MTITSAYQKVQSARDDIKKVMASGEDSFRNRAALHNAERYLATAERLLFEAGNSKDPTG